MSRARTRGRSSPAGSTAGRSGGRAHRTGDRAAGDGPAEGPRRFGKTSVLRKVGAGLEQAGTQVVWVDLYEVRSMADIATRFDDHGLARTQPLRRGRRGHRRQPLGQPRGAAGGALPRPHRPDGVVLFETLLDVCIAHAARSHPTVLVIDEFSGMARGRRGRPACCAPTFSSTTTGTWGWSRRLRALDDAHPVRRRAEPFYGQADLAEIGPLSAPAVTRIVGTGSPPPVATPATSPPSSTASPWATPRPTMQLTANATWRATSPGESFHPDRSAGPRRRAPGHRTAQRAALLAVRRGEKAVLRIVASGGRISAGRPASSSSPRARPAARANLLAGGDLVADGEATGSGGSTWSTPSSPTGCGTGSPCRRAPRSPPRSPAGAPPGAPRSPGRPERSGSRPSAVPSPVDPDKLTGSMLADGLVPAPSADDADLVVVNTCSFIEEAKAEVDRRHPRARRPPCRGVAARRSWVHGQALGQELADAMPEADVVAGFGVPVTLTAKPGRRALKATSDGARARPAQPAPPTRRPSVGVREGGRGAATRRAASAPSRRSGGRSAPARSTPRF